MFKGSFDFLKDTEKYWEIVHNSKLVSTWKMTKKACHWLGIQKTVPIY